VFRSGDRVEVLVAATDIAPGQEIGPDDLTTAQVAAEGASFVLAEAESSFVGSTSVVGIPAGTMINNVMFQAGTVVPDDADVVGLVLTAQQRPAEPIGQGDVVRLFLVPRNDQLSGEGAEGSELVAAARVVEAVDGGSQGLSVSVLIPEVDAGAVVAGSATGQVAVTRLADDTEPVVDFVTQD
jgi:flagella basal body P-ring formation protein FlgA